MTLQSFPSQEIVLRDAIRSWQSLTGDSARQVGRDELGDLEGRPWYIRVIKLPAGGADQIQGDFVFDIEVFAPTYTGADSLARDLDAFLLGYPHVVEVDGQRVVIDRVTQNVGPGEIPWEDPAVHRILATYVITMRR